MARTKLIKTYDFLYFVFRADISRRCSVRVRHDDRFCQTIRTRARRRNRSRGRGRALRQLVHVTQRSP